MTQPAKVQEPSMEEILASIRRIISDDEAKPVAADKPSGPAAPAKPEPAAKAPASDAASPAPAVPKAVSPPPPAPRAAPTPAPAQVETNSQDDIDALLNGLDEATTPEEIRSASSDGDVLELTDEMALPDPPRPAFKKVEPADDLEFAEAGRAVPRPPLFETPAVESPVAVQQILSRSTVSAVESAFNSLAHTVLSQNARTLEDLVKEMLRPMLKSWLDDNLPGLVERIVKAEIERVSRGR
jgi:cell pole-organizing protein PopZ